MICLRWCTYVTTQWPFRDSAKMSFMREGHRHIKVWQINNFRGIRISVNMWVFQTWEISSTLISRTNFCRAIESISEALWALVDKGCLVNSFDAHRNPTQGSNNVWPRNIYPLCIFGSAAKHFVHLPRAEVRMSLRLIIASRLLL